MSRHRGFTLVEVLVVIGITSLLAALLLPVFISVRERARIAPCTSNLRQIHLAREMYMQDNGFPPDKLHWLYPSYVSDKRIFVCPNDRWLEYGGWNWVGWQSQGIPPKDGRPPVSYGYVPLKNADIYDPAGRQMLKITKDATKETAGYASCQLHGKEGGKLMTSPNGEAIASGYTGLTLRLCFDGSVRRAHRPESGNVAYMWDVE